MTFDCHASDLRPVPVALQVEITPDEWVSSRANGSNDTEETPLTPMLEGTDATEHVRSGGIVEEDGMVVFHCKLVVLHFHDDSVEYLPGILDDILPVGTR